MRFPLAPSVRHRVCRAVTSLGLAGAPLLVACDGPAEGLVIEQLPAVEPDLPAVPTLPPPPHPIQYPDDSYSVYGVRKKQRVTMDDQVEVTGTIVEIYQPPPCERGQRCQASAPHLWIADEAGDTEPEKRLMVVGYAENQAAIDEAVELAKRGRYEPPDPESGLLPIPTDLAVGNKVKVKGRFARVSGSGFNSSIGLLDYLGHETLSAPAAE